MDKGTITIKEDGYNQLIRGNMAGLSRLQQLRQ
jgi:hypothetical protein